VQEFNDFIVFMESWDNNPVGEGSSSGPSNMGPPPPQMPPGWKVTYAEGQEMKRKREKEAQEQSKANKKQKQKAHEREVLKKRRDAQNRHRVKQEKIREKRPPGWKGPNRAKFGKQRGQWLKKIGDFKLRYRRIPSDWPPYRYYDRKICQFVHPEMFHHSPPTQVLFSKTMRIYEEGHLRYTYYCNFHSEKARYCKVTYPDGTYLFMFDKYRLFKHIEYNHYNTHLGYSMKPPFILHDYFSTRFDKYRIKKVKEFFKKPNEQ
jgi:hypothetical protein